MYKKFPYFSRLSNTPLYIYICHLWRLNEYHHSFFKGSLGSFHVSAVIMLLWTWACRYLFKSLLSLFLGTQQKRTYQIIGSVLCLNFRGATILFSTAATSLHSYQQCIRVPLSLYPYQHLFFSFSFLFLFWSRHFTVQLPLWAIGLNPPGALGGRTECTSESPTQGTGELGCSSTDSGPICWGPPDIALRQRVHGTGVLMGQEWWWDRRGHGDVSASLRSLNFLWQQAPLPVAQQWKHHIHIRGWLWNYLWGLGKQERSNHIGDNPLLSRPSVRLVNFWVC